MKNYKKENYKNRCVFISCSSGYYRCEMTNFGQSSSIGLAFSNIEALAADGEAGAHGKKCSFGKQYTGKEYDTAYECINRGRTVCIIWGKYIQLGSSEGYCTNAQ